jgi:MscS family membrane protein
MDIALQILAQSETLTVFDRLELDMTLMNTGWTGWLVLFAGVFIGVLAGKAAQNLLRAIGLRLVARGWTVRGMFFTSAAGPGNLVFTTMGISIGMTRLAVSDAMLRFSAGTLAFLYLVAVGWLVYNLVDIVAFWLRRWTASTRSRLDDQVIPLLSKTMKIFVIIVFALFAADNIFGADISAWLAGLGIAGLAISLAAQESIKNIFGSITIFLDRPFVVGDVISWGAHTGTVEEIGFRSTRIRTLEGHQVTVPNSKIVDNDVRNIARRPAIRRTFDVTITYDTPPEKIERAVAILRDILADPAIASAFNIEKFPPRVFFDALNADSLNIRVNYWFTPGNDWWAYQAHAHQVNLLLVRGFNDAGIDFAFPTRTLHLAGDQRRELAIRMLDGTNGREPGQE